MGKFKKITRAGGITIPAELRRDLGIQSGDGMEIEVDYASKTIQLKRYQVRCALCATADDVLILYGNGICRTCAEKAYNALKGE